MRADEQSTSCWGWWCIVEQGCVNGVCNKWLYAGEHHAAVQEAIAFAVFDEGTYGACERSALPCT